MAIRSNNRLGRALRHASAILHGDDGSNLLELAVALPLLVVFVVGIFDFGQAFNIKQQLNNAAREGARLASNQPTSDLSTTAPASVQTIRDTVDAYLLAAKINDCGLGNPTASGSGTLVWTSTGTGCGGTFTLKIERSYSCPATINGGSGPSTLNVVATRVSMSYPFQWHFGNVIRLLVPGASYSGTLQIGTDAVVPNMN